MPPRKKEVSEETIKEAEDVVGFDLKTIKKEWRSKVKFGVDFKDDELEVTPTDSISLDWALGKPFLQGSIVEVFAENATGKTTLALHVCKNGMNLRGAKVFYHDLERKLREAQINMIEGFNRDLFHILYPDTGEECMNMIHDLAMDHPGSIHVLDSVGGLLAEVEDAENFEKQTMGVVARLCHKMIRKLSGKLATQKALLICLNHPTATMELYGRKDNTHGGNAIRNRAAQRIQLVANSSAAIKEGDNRIGQVVRATVVKNNVNRPFITVNFPIIYGKGIDANLDIIEFGKTIGVITTGGGWKYVPNPDGGDPIPMRESDIYEKLKTDSAFKACLVDKIKEFIG